MKAATGEGDCLEKKNGTNDFRQMVAAEEAV
jgi:hypothetical protein